jgi:N-acetylglucosaminyldiphosphoundecaprenol N-acetyl-beta-D-mannosaminyltransferase
MTRFVFSGRLVDWKRVDLLIAAFKVVTLSHPACLMIIGEGPMRSDLESQVEELGLAEVVRFSGWLSQSESSAILARSDVFVLPSIYESGGAVLLEAMASGLPVIASKWGGPTDYIDPSCGILVDADGPDILVSGLTKAMLELSGAPDRRRTMGLSGRQKVETTAFNWEIKIQRILEIYAEACASYRGTQRGGTSAGPSGSCGCLTVLARPETPRPKLGPNLKPVAMVPNEAFGVRFSLLPRSKIIEKLLEPGSTSDPRLRFVVTANVDHIVTLRRSSAFRAAYGGAFIATVDGAPVWLYLRLKGVRVPERVTGADLVPAIVAALDPGEHRVFVVASSEEAARGFLGAARRSNPDLAVAYLVPPFGFDSDPDYGSELIRQLRVHGTTHLLMGVGAPKSEVWLYEHRGHLPDLVALCVGSGIDFFAGTSRRAPNWMRSFGLEWMFRLGREPRRLAKRYLFTSWGFLAAVADDVLGRFR